MRLGLGGGRGGVDTWGRMAGEEPDVRWLRGEGESSGEDWFAELGDVKGAWGLAVRHRVKWREERGESMWLLKGGAGEMAAGVNKEEKRDSKAKRREVDAILDQILKTV